MATAATMPAAWLEIKKEAEAAYHKRDFEQAILGYSQALDRLKESNSEGQPHFELSKLLSNRCMAHQQLGKWEDAVTDAQSAVKMKPDWEKAWYRLGSSLLGCTGRRHDAKLAFEHGLRLKPGNAQLKQQLERLSKEQAAEGDASQHAASSAGVQFRSFLNDVFGAKPSCNDSGGSLGGDRSGSGGEEYGKLPQRAASVPHPLTPETSAEVVSVSSASDAAGAPAVSSSDELAEAQKQLGNERYKEGKYEDAVRGLCPPSPQKAVLPTAGPARLCTPPNWPGARASRAALSATNGLAPCRPFARCSPCPAGCCCLDPLPLHIHCTSPPCRVQPWGRQCKERQPLSHSLARDLLPPLSAGAVLHRGH